MSNAWLLAVPGVREGWGQVVTDANALGTPVVGYNIRGLRDSIKHGNNGFIVPNNPKSLSKGILKVLTDEQIRKSLSTSSIESVRKYSWDKTTDEFINIIEG